MVFPSSWPALRCAFVSTRLSELVSKISIRDDYCQAVVQVQFAEYRRHVLASPDRLYGSQLEPRGSISAQIPVVQERLEWRTIRVMVTSCRITLRTYRLLKLPCGTNHALAAAHDFFQANVLQVCRKGYTAVETL